MAPMAFSDSEVYTNKTCSKTCLNNYETLKKQFDDLLVKLNESEFKAATYKRGLATLEAQLITYRKNEVLFSKEVAFLKREVACKNYEINILKSELEKVKQEKDGIDLNWRNYDRAAQDVDHLLGSQINDKSKTGFRPEFKGYGPEKSKQESIWNMSPKAVLLKTGLTPLNTVRPVNTAHPKIAVHSAKSKTHFSKQAQSTAKRPIYKQTTLTRRSVHTAKRHYYTGRYNAVNTARSYTGQVNAVRGKPQHDDKRFVDSGCSRHMTRNIAYLSDFKDFDGGYVAFGGGAYGGRITEHVEYLMLNASPLK
ncbi:hypothetical protein Tco_0300348 [Tanacetum coccineum]